MLPASLSATAIDNFENCPAGYKAQNIDRVPDMGGRAANLGSAVHEALELWVKSNHHIFAWPDIMARERQMHAIWTQVYYNYFSDKEAFAEGWGMLRRWLQRTDWEGRTVISTEIKQSFPIKIDGQEIPFNFIFDRCDRIDSSGEIEVWDYKTVGQPVNPEQLKLRIQPRAYALAAQVLWPDAPAIWVGYDLLRYDTIATRFTREDNIETYRYLQNVARRILDSDGTQEILNPNCKWCPRIAVCATLQKRASLVEPPTTDINVLADRRARVDWAARALMNRRDELDRELLDICERENKTEFKTDTVAVQIKMGNRRVIESELASKVVGPELMVEYGKLGITEFDRLMKDDRLTHDQKAELKRLVRNNYTAPRIDTKPISPHDGDSDG